MRKTLRATTVPAALFALLSAATAFAADKNFKADLEGFQEVPVVSSVASGEFRANLSNDETTISYVLTYSGLEGSVRQSHIHFGQHSVNGSIVVFLCQTVTNPDPTGLAPTCPQEGTVSGLLTVSNMTSLASGQGIAAGDFEEFIQALRGGVTYANVHSSMWPGGEIRGQIK
jgi:hypothetical protein